MFYQFMRKHQTSSSIVLFVLVMLLIQYSQPTFMCNIDGSYKSFGLGYRNKTIVPMWLVVILVAILSYTAVMFTISKNNNYY